MNGWYAFVEFHRREWASRALLAAFLPIAMQRYDVAPLCSKKSEQTVHFFCVCARFLWFLGGF